MNLHFLGGAMEIGGSCIYLKTAGKGILMDSGIRQSGTKDPIPDFRTLQEQGGLDAILISHAHMDHIGTLPLVSKAYPNAPIYMTAMTADLTRVLLYDSLKIMNNREGEIPHYSEQDVLAMLGRIHVVGFQTPFPILADITLTFYPAGHIAGAACIYLTTPDGSLFYSGDFSAFSQRTIEGISIPKLQPDAVIVETTYGNRLHANRQVEEKRLVELVRECILERKKILIPAFALGRAQEVLLILRTAIQNQEIPAVPVYVDGMVRDINTMYTRNPTFLKNALAKRILKGNEPFYTKEIQAVAPMQNREELLSSSDPAIFLSSSGMLTGGPSVQYAQKLAFSENACIIITGYQDEESPGRKLLNLLENPEDAALSLNGSSVPVKCRIEQVGLSAHGDKLEIQSLLDRLSPRHIFLVHGNQDSIEELGHELAEQDYHRQVYLPECGQSYEITFHRKKKQTPFIPAYTLQRTQEYTSADAKLLWEYWQEHYPGMHFAVSQIAYIWYGKSISDDTILQSMQKELGESSYFVPNARRLFLWDTVSPEDLAAILAPKELAQQELSAQVEKIFSIFPYRKISYHNDRKEIILQFDYPDVQDQQSFAEAAAAFTEVTGWQAAINPATNHNAASILLSSLFEDRITKISYHVERRNYAITLTGNSGTKDQDAADRFHAMTGWSLSVNGECLSPSSAASHLSTGSESDADGETALKYGSEESESGFFLPHNPSTETAEQNLAFYCIDQVFENLPHTPDRKSLKQDSDGKYLEISFISPVVGHRYHNELQSLADQTGWRIMIADKVNQNELFKIAQLLCMKYGISLNKNPSYLPERRAVQLKVQASAGSESLQQAADEFLEKTGCICNFICL